MCWVGSALVQQLKRGDYPASFSRILLAVTFPAPASCILTMHWIYMFCYYQLKLNIGVRLGGFNVLLGFLGSVRSFMRGFGLEEVLYCLFCIVRMWLNKLCSVESMAGLFMDTSLFTWLLFIDKYVVTNRCVRFADVTFLDPNDAQKYWVDADDIEALTDLCSWWENVVNSGWTDFRWYLGTWVPTNQQCDKFWIQNNRLELISSTNIELHVCRFCT